MKATIITWNTGRRAAALFIFFLLCAGLLGFPEAAATGVKRGLAVCGEVLVPTLLPFMALASFLVESGLSDTLGRRLGWLTTRCFGLPGCCAAGILLSFIGGYPAGAAACAKLVARRALSEAEARRMMRFCVVAGPAFVVGTVGAGLLGSVRHGWLLLFSEWAAALTLGLLFGCTRAPEPPKPPACAPPKPLPTAVSVSVGEAARSMLVMCAFVCAVACGLSVLDALSLPFALTDALAAVTEVTVGCLAVSPNLTLLAACIGFGGLSVHGQIGSLFPFSLLDRGFFAARALQAALAALFSWVLFRFCPLPVEVFAAGQVRLAPFSCGFTGSLALCATVAIALLSAPRTAS